MERMTSDWLKFKSLVLAFMLISGPVSAQTIEPGPVVGRCRVLLYAAGDSGQVGLAERTAAGRQLLVEQLRQCGVADEDIQQVYTDAQKQNFTGRGRGVAVEDLQQADGPTFEQLKPLLRTLANAARPEDTLLVVLLGAGVHRQAKDLLLGPDGSDATGAVQVQDVVDLLSTSSCQHQVLIVDGGVSEAMAEAVPDTREFGTGELQLVSGQTVILSRCQSQRGRGSLFSAVIADAMTELADQSAEGGDQPATGVINPGDGVITELEFTQYLLSYATNYRMTPIPRISSKRPNNFSLLKAARLDESPRLRPDSRRQMVDFLMQSAYQSLLLNNQPEDGRLALQRALSFRPSAEQREEIIGLWLTSLCADGRWQDAWPIAVDRKQPLLLIAPAGLPLQSGNTIVARLKGNEVLLLSGRQAGFLKVQQVLRPSFAAEGISYSVDSVLKNVNLSEKELQTFYYSERPTGSRDDALRLVEILRSIEAKE